LIGFGGDWGKENKKVHVVLFYLLKEDRTLIDHESFKDLFYFSKSKACLGSIGLIIWV
jgi:hypothetical protein